MSKLGVNIDHVATLRNARGENHVNISSVEMVEKTKTSINFRFNLIISDLKNFTKLISELKQREYKFKIIRHKNKKYAFFKKFFGSFKKN